jgi:hypothetical protein
MFAGDQANGFDFSCGQRHELFDDDLQGGYAITRLRGGRPRR